MNARQKEREKVTNYAHIGVVGRKTGIRIKEAPKDELGMEVLDAFFSPETTNRAEQSMSMATLNVTESSLVNNTKTALTPLRRKSPVKTHLNSPALRVLSARKELDSRRLNRSPENEDTLRPPLSPISPVTRKLDFGKLQTNESEVIQENVVASIPEQQQYALEFQERSFSMIEELDVPSEPEIPFITTVESPLSFSPPKHEVTKINADIQSFPKAMLTQAEVNVPKKVAKKNTEKQTELSQAITAKKPGRPSKQANKCLASEKAENQRYKPFDFLRGERIIYSLTRKRTGGQGSSAPKSEKLRANEKNSRISSHKNEITRNRPSSGVDSDGEVSSDLGSSSDDFEAEDEVQANIFDYETNSYRKELVAIADSKIPLQESSNKTFSFKNVFKEGDYAASGIVELEPGKSKEPKPTRHNCMLFYVISGKIQAAIHQTAFRLKKGGHFLVPRGNSYEITNIGHRKARLLFLQATDTLYNYNMINAAESPA